MQAPKFVRTAEHPHLHPTAAALMFNEYSNEPRWVVTCPNAKSRAIVSDYSLQSREQGRARMQNACYR